MQADFAAALLDPEAPLPPGLRAWNGAPPVRRFAVHRNTVVVSLMAALAETFPATRECMGAPQFEALARGYVRCHPPTSPILADYGAGFAAFLAGSAAATVRPALPDLARLEHARVRAFHAADATPLAPADLAATLAEPDRLPAARLQLHPSVAVIASQHPVVALWAAHHGHVAPAEAATAGPQAALVLRADDDAAVVALPHAAARFVRALAAGTALGAAASTAAGRAGPDGTPFDLAATLGLLITHAAIVGWISPGDRE